MAPTKFVPENHRTYLANGVFNQVEFLGTDAMGGGHGDMRNAGGMHQKMMANAKVRKPTAGETMNFADFVQQDEDAKKRAKENAKRPDAKKVKQIVGPGKLAPTIDTGGGRRARMVVGVRIRPLFEKEQRKGCHNVLEVKEGREVFAYDPDDKVRACARSASALMRQASGLPRSFFQAALLRGGRVAVAVVSRAAIVMPPQQRHARTWRA